MSHTFHPSVENWFIKEFSLPTEIQRRAWPAIQQKQNTLIAAPTGSGKTLAAFLAAINDLVQRGLEGSLLAQTQIVYISPLKALSNDIEKNLQRPLAGIEEELNLLGLPQVPVRVLVRTGDTPASARTAMTKNPPHILVTTPESLFLLVTSDGGRSMLSNVHTVIVDEIHALVRDKRGSHLSLTLERLETLTKNKPVRIGISATQKPIEEIARFLVGNGHTEHGRSVTKSETPLTLQQAQGDDINCTIIDTGHKRKLDLSIEVPGSPLSAVMPNEVWLEIYERLVELIREHRTTLIFVNTRRLAERIAHTLTERLGPDAITAHHGSMSKEHRLQAEQRLKSGSLRALVATASLELGIDIGSVDLVCQIASPKSIATFLQRVGRSGHTVTGTPKGKLFPLTRDELVECAAIFDAVRRGELDRIIIPEKPIDILAQQIIAEVACGEYAEKDLYELVRRAYPYRNLSRQEFDEVITMLSDGFTTRRGRRGAYLFHDVVNETLRARKGARLSAITSGGAIPDSFDYEVRLEPSNTFIGTLNEDFAFESSAGDIFQLGNNSWKILRVENGVVRVSDAGSTPPNIPFWLGEAPGRTMELSFAVSRLREEISNRLDTTELATASNEADAAWKQPALRMLTEDIGVERSAADQIVMYFGASKAALNCLPTQTTIVLERFFDQAGDMHLIIHSPFGSRMNRAWGLSLRKRFCRKFNFELQAAATEDAIVLSLGSTHSFPLDEVFSYLNSKTVRDILIQAVFDSPMFELRWRWNATNSLAMLRRRNGKRVPAQLQRMNAQDLVALIFPDQLACLENIAGDREIPDHPLVRQTISDCLFEAMAVDELETLLRKIEDKSIQLIAKDLREPSPLSEEILNARPYAFLDDAPLEERRSRAVANRRFIDPSDASELGKLDIAAIRTVQSEAWPDAENKDELHDALVLLGFMTGSEINKNPDWKTYFDELAAHGRVSVLYNENKVPLCIPVERLPQWKAIFQSFELAPELILPERLVNQVWTEERALTEIVRGRLEGLGPVTATDIARSSGMELSSIEAALLALENEGFVFRGHFTSETAETEWCERRLLARIHRYTLDKLRKEIEPVSAADFMRFLFSWQHLDPSEKLEGPEALQVVLRQLEGFEAPAAAWESDILTARIADYDHHWLDMSCLSGITSWGRFRIQKTSGKSPVKSTPIMLVQRTNVSFWKQFHLSENDTNLSLPASQIIEFLKQRGASFFHDLVEKTGLLKSQAEDAVGELVAAGLIVSDSFAGLRALLVPAKYKLAGTKTRGRKQAPFTMDQAGRWTLLHEVHTEEKQIPDSEVLEITARILLKRYGVMFRKLADRESVAPPWRELVRVYRKLEARGEIRGGRFVEGVWGEQFALPEALTKLRSTRKEEKSGKLISISAADPLNLQGILTPGKKVSAFLGNRILYRDGEPCAVHESGENIFLVHADDSEKWKWQNALIRRTISPLLRPYLGKGIA
ncbi:DEAD/DEAH box helicase [bacterium]|nr:MAG: DEAD/DEAH box helicase [bacterium]